MKCGYNLWVLLKRSKWRWANHTFSETLKSYWLRFGEGFKRCIAREDWTWVNKKRSRQKPTASLHVQQFAVGSWGSVSPAVAACCVSNNALILCCKLQETQLYWLSRTPIWSDLSGSSHMLQEKVYIASTWRCICWTLYLIAWKGIWPRWIFSTVSLRCFSRQKNTSFFIPFCWDSKKGRFLVLSQATSTVAFWYAFFLERPKDPKDGAPQWELHITGYKRGEKHTISTAIPKTPLVSVVFYPCCCQVLCNLSHSQRVHV